MDGRVYPPKWRSGVRRFGLKADTLMRMQSAHELAEALAHDDEIAVERVAA